MHARFCTDQRLLRTSAQALEEQRRRESAAFAVPCPVCDAPAGEPCIDTRRRIRAIPYTFLDGSPRAHIKRRTLAA
ncbi:hypothetical protein [Streptomyces sp. NPDC087300]|uniref:zinc finger domain-containing protein n=1 Tax=Streptomyces sp. NPDC087300 TaxID=3365780 RepID=UPI0037F52C37